jgi:hypothetical protein
VLGTTKMLTFPIFRPVLFDSNTVKKFAKVEIGRDHLSTFSFKNKCMTDMQNTERYFRIPDYKTEPQAFKFGDKPNSFVFIKNSLMGKKCVLEFQFRTFYPNGLLFLSDVSRFQLKCNLKMQFVLFSVSFIQRKY